MIARQRYRNSHVGVKTYEQSVEDFWSRVDSTHLDNPLECWEWTGGQRLPKGYGICSFQGKKTLAHRASYLVHFGSIPNGLCVCHRCDNPSCVNPNHLFLGTAADNIRDCVQKGRNFMRPGVYHPQAKLTESDVIKLRTCVGISHSELAKQYGVSRQTIGDAISGRNWKYLKAKTAATNNGRNGRQNGQAKV